MKSERKSYVEYKGLGVQRMTSEETSESIYWSIYH